MFRASSLLLIAIILATLLGSSTPRPVTVVPPSEEAGPEELTPLSQDHEHLDVDQHSLQEELSPAAAEEAAVSPEEPPLKEDNAGTVTPPEYPMPDDTLGAEPQDVETVEPLTSDQEEAPKVEAASDETGPAEISPYETPEEIDQTGALEGMPAEDWSQITVIPPEAFADTDADANAETEEDSLGLSTEEDQHLMFQTEGTTQEEAALEQFASQQPAVEVPGGLTDTEEDQKEASPALLSESDGEEETNEPAAEKNTEIAPTDGEPPPSVLSEDESDVSPALDARLEPDDAETAVEEVVVLSDNSEEELGEKVSAESADQEASEKHEHLETKENAEQTSPHSISLLEEDETVAVISGVIEESQEDPAATIPSTIEEVEEMAKEDENLSASHQEGSEEAEVLTPNSPNDGGASLVEEEAIIISNTDENNEEGAATSSSPLEASEEVLEEMVLSVSTGDFHQEPSKETEVETKVTSTPNVVPAAPEEDQTLALTSDPDKESHQKAAEGLATEEPPVSLLQEPDPEDLVLIVVLEDKIQSDFQPESADQEASEKHEHLETKENAEQTSPHSISLLEEDETVAVISGVIEESQEDPAATIPSTIEEVEEMAKEDENLSAPHQEGSEEAEVLTPNSPNDGGASLVEEEAIIISNTDENNEEGAATSSSPLEASEEVLEEMVLSVSTGDFHQEPSKETEVETKVTSTPNVVPAVPEEDQTLALTSDPDKESHQKAAEGLATEEPPVSLLQEPDPEDLVLIVVLEDKIQSHFQPEEAAAQPEDTEGSELVVSGTAATQEVQQPALVNRGAVLGAALFTLVSFITMGFIWTTVAKKLR